MPSHRAIVIDALGDNWNPWSGLKLFQNEEWLNDQLTRRHAIVKHQKSNSTKQARHIRYAIMQAREFWDAAVQASAATRPLQLYYSCMSLGLAEILWKGTGEHSIDRLRENNGHHGLDFNWPSNSLDVSSLDKIVVRPHISGGKRKGTFEVWHNFAREYPLVGIKEDREKNTASPDALFLPTSDRLPYLPAFGLSLKTLYGAVPRMESPLNSIGLDTQTIRATLALTIWKCSNGFDYMHRLDFTAQPGVKEAVAQLARQIHLSIRSEPETTVHEFENGFMVSQNSFVNRQGHTGGFKLPTGSSYGSNLTFFSPFVPYLNEFGILYVTLFVLGMLSRYYPDLWMKELDKHSSFSYLAEEFTRIALRRIPLLSLSTLENCTYVTNGSGLAI